MNIEEVVYSYTNHQLSRRFVVTFDFINVCRMVARALLTTFVSGKMLWLYYLMHMHSKYQCVCIFRIHRKKGFDQRQPCVNRCKLKVDDDYENDVDDDEMNRKSTDRPPSTSSVLYIYVSSSCFCLLYAFYHFMIDVDFLTYQVHTHSRTHMHVLLLRRGEENNW